jgi:glycosyltransferase involved in cell wall biosynthesis
MRSLLYISFLNEDIRPGYKSKIHSQCEAFSNLNTETYLYIVNNNGIIIYKINGNKEEIIKEIPANRSRFLTRRNIIDELFLFKIFIESLIEFVNNLKPDIIYVRRILPITFKLIKALKSFKEKGITVLYEYPTFPWEKEMLRNKQLIFYVIDKLLYKFLVKSVSKVVVVGTKGSLSDKYIEISNAISLNRIPKRIPTENNKKTINLLGVAHVSLFHGYDRLIEGLKSYYNSQNEYQIVFNIVGPVDKRLNLEGMVEKYNLNNYVKFLGYKTGSELDRLFNEADIGIGCLGVHRKGIHYLNSLKNREYAARGIPFIFSECDVIIEQKKPNFILKMSENDMPININDIIAFYNSPKDSVEEIRKFANESLSWDTQMKKVYDNLKDN